MWSQVKNTFDIYELLLKQATILKQWVNKDIVVNNFE